MTEEARKLADKYERWANEDRIPDTIEAEYRLIAAALRSQPGTLAREEAKHQIVRAFIDRGVSRVSAPHLAEAALDAILALTPSHEARTQEPVADLFKNIKERLSEGDGLWMTCTGCYESEDGQNVHGYPHSSIFGCTLGGGCGECGGIGAVWDTTDYGAMADELVAEMNAAPASHGATREALFEPETAHAGWNLEGALHDIRRLSEAGKPTDAVCIRTIERVCKQLFNAEAALTLTLRGERVQAGAISADDGEKS